MLLAGLVWETRTYAQIWAHQSNKQIQPELPLYYLQGLTIAVIAYRPTDDDAARRLRGPFRAEATFIKANFLARAAAAHAAHLILS